MIPVIVEQSYAAPVRTVWKALTDPSRMREWYFDVIEDFKPVVGFQTRFVVRNGDKIYPHSWTVTGVKPEKSITYDWTYEGYTGYSFVKFELFPHDGGTKLRLTAEGIESFPQDNPDFSRESCTNGWTYLLCTRLTDYLGRSTADDLK